MAVILLEALAYCLQQRIHISSLAPNSDSLQERAKSLYADMDAGKIPIPKSFEEWKDLARSILREN